MKAELTRYWVEYSEPRPFLAKLGVGVTAFDVNDAISLISSSLSVGGEVAHIRANIDVRDLDQNHIVPNMGAPSDRGVWFPLT